MKETRAGSLLDLLPRPKSVEYNALPQFIRAEIDLLHKGGRPVVSDDLREVLDHVATIPKRLDELARDMRVEIGLVRDALKATAASNARLVEALAALQKEQSASRVWLTDHEKRLDAHDVQLGVHAKKHVEHAAEITGVHKRIVVLEETVLTKRKTRKRK